MEWEGIVMGCFEIRHFIYSHFLLYRICTFLIAHTCIYVLILSIALVRPKLTMDADVNIL